MAIRTLRPNGTVSNTYTLTGTGTADQILADDTVSSIDQGNEAARSAEFNFATTTIGANERVARVRHRAKIYAFLAGKVDAALKLGGVQGATSTYGDDGSPSATIRTGPWYTTTPDDASEWVQADIDAVRMTLASPTRTISDAASIQEAYIDVDVRTKPTVSVASPTADQVMPGSPAAVSWTYNGDGDVQKKYRVRAFTQADAEAGGFDVTTTTPLWDSGEVSSSSSSTSVPDLENGEVYYVFVQVAKDFNGADWWSDWSAGRRFSINDRPTATVTAPTGSVTDTNRPTVVWSYADTEGDPQSAFQVRVYAEPAGGWVGFDPDTTEEVPAWDSGMTASTASTVQVATALDNLTDYRAYVRVRHATPSTATSLWASSDFATNFTPPATPTLTVTEAGEDRIELLLDDNATVPASAWLTVERSVDGGPWETFRYGTLVETSAIDPAMTPLALVDYEVPLGLEVQYRALAVTTDSGEEVASPWTATVAGTATGAAIFLRDPADAAAGLHFPSRDDWVTFTHRRQRTVVEPLGRELPVVVRGAARGRSVAVTFALASEALHEALLALLEADATLYLQTPRGSLYVEVSGDLGDEGYLWTDVADPEALWAVTVPFVEVDL